MNIREVIEVGEITPQLFQLYTVTAIQEDSSYKKGLPEELVKITNNDVYINIKSPTEIHVAKINFRNNCDTFIHFYIFYENGSIIIDSESSYTFHVEASDDIHNKIATNLDKLLKNNIDRLLEKFAICLKLSSEISKIPSFFKPVFNPITCFNTTSNQIENIRLTPHGSIKDINKPETYNSFKEFNRRLQLFASDEHECCLSSDKDRFDNGPFYALYNNEITRKFSNGNSETWLPLYSLIADTKIKINTPLYVKPAESTNGGAWLYIATNGIIYGDTIIKAGMQYKVIETENGQVELITYKDENHEISLPLIANELILIRGNEHHKPIRLDVERVVEKDIFTSCSDTERVVEEDIFTSDSDVEQVIDEDVFASDSEELANLMANIENLNDSLIDGAYYDGTKFERLFTYDFLKLEGKEGYLEKFRNMLTDACDSPKGFYQEHKIAVWIVVVVLLLLVRTCI